jgi:hypothetical protein
VRLRFEKSIGDPGPSAARGRAALRAGFPNAGPS